MMKKTTLIFAFLTFLSYVVISQPQLTWQFANYEVINAGAKLQFDVEVKADVGTSFHRDLQVYFNYNTAGFGSDVVAGGNITVTPLVLMDNFYVVVNTADNTSSKVAVITEATNEMDEPGSATYFNLMPSTFTGLLRITMNITDNTATAGIDFDETLMNGGQYYQSTINTDALKYVDPCLYDNDLLSDYLGTLYGTITYANLAMTPLSNCTVTIGGVGTAETDVTGFYNYSGIYDGIFTLTTTCSLPYTYITNVGDANVVIDHILGSPLIGVFFLAGDVTGSGIIDVGDLNLMIDEILGIGTGYLIPDWVFEDQIVTVAGGIATRDYQGLMAGDADGSW